MCVLYAGVSLGVGCEGLVKVEEVVLTESFVAVTFAAG